MSKKISQLPPFVGALPNNAKVPVSVNGTTYKADKSQVSSDSLTPDQIDAIQNANTPNGSNHFATMSDLSSGGTGLTPYVELDPDRDFTIADLSRLLLPEQDGSAYGVYSIPSGMFSLGNRIEFLAQTIGAFTVVLVVPTGINVVLNGVTITDDYRFIPQGYKGILICTGGDNWVMTYELGHQALSIDGSNANGDVNIGGNSLYSKELFIYDNSNGTYGKISLNDRAYVFFNDLGESLGSFSSNLINFGTNGWSNIRSSLLSTNRYYDLPDKSGTIALLDDVIAYGIDDVLNIENIAINKTFVINDLTSSYNTSIDYSTVNITNYVDNVNASLSSGGLSVADSNQSLSLLKNIIEFIKSGATTKITFSDPTGNGTYNFRDLGSATKDVATTDEIPSITGLESTSNKTSTITGNETSTTLYSNIKGIVDYFTSTKIKTILGITTLSGSNTGDQDLSGLVPTSRTVNSKALSSNITLNTDDIAESGTPTNKWWTNARTIASTLTGFSSGTGTVSSSDTILQAIQKIVGNINALVTGVSSVNTKTGAVTLTLADVGLNFTPYKFISTTQTAVTGSVSETIVATATINGNTFNATDVMKILFRLTKGITTSNVSLRLRVNTINSLSGATQVGIYNFLLSNTQSLFLRTFDLNGGNLYGFNFNSSAQNDFTSGATSPNSTAYNTANTLYFFFTVQLGTSGDSITPNLANITN